MVYMNCVMDGCEGVAKRLKKTLCEKHYYRQYRYGDPSVNKRPELSTPANERVWWYVDKTAGCWLWTGAKDTAGYGTFGLDKAHRFVFRLLKGEIPAGLDLDHLCRVRHCVNPDHLEAVTHRENVLRGEGLAAQQARKTECPKGHPYDEANTRVYRGRRFCRACGRGRYQPKSLRP